MSERSVFMRTEEAVTILVPEGQVGSEMSTQVTLTAPMLLDLHNTPVIAVPSPGNGVVAIPVMITRNLRVNGSNGFSTPELEAVEVVIPGSAIIPELFEAGTTYDSDTLKTFPEAILLPDITEDPAGDFQGDISITVGDPLEFEQGAIVTSAKAAGGTGYAIGDLIYLADAILRVLTLSTTAVGTYSVVTAGTIIATGVGQATTSSGLGTGFTLTVTAIDTEANPTEVDVKVWYKLVDIL